MYLEGLEDETSGVKRIAASYKKFIIEGEFDESNLSIEQIILSENEIGYHPGLIPS